MERRDKTNYYLDISQTVAERGTCLRRNFGAILVKNDEIIATGYKGAPRGRKNCSNIGECMHAEANCIISASRHDMIGSALYLSCLDAKTGQLYGDVEPCSMCKRQIINAGIETVYIRVTSSEYRVMKVSDWVDNDESLTGSEGY